MSAWKKVSEEMPPLRVPCWVIKEKNRGPTVVQFDAALSSAEPYGVYYQIGDERDWPVPLEAQWCLVEEPDLPYPEEFMKEVVSEIARRKLLPEANLTQEERERLIYWSGWIENKSAPWGMISGEEDE